MSDAAEVAAPGWFGSLWDRVKPKPKAKKKKRRWGERILGWFTGARFIALLILFGMTALRFLDPFPVEYLRLQVFDAYQRLEPRTLIPGPLGPDGQFPIWDIAMTPDAPRGVAIVDIDEASMAELGQWPWSRSVLANLLNNLMAYGVLVVGFDVFFVEPDRTSPGLIAQNLPELDEGVRNALLSLPSNDQVFADKLAQSRVVLAQSGLIQSTGAKLPSFTTPVARGPRVDGGGLEFIKRNLLTYAGVAGNIPLLDEATPGRGMVTVLEEIDGLVRRMPMALRVEENIYNSLTLEMLRIATGRPSYQIRYDMQGIESFVIAPGMSTPTDNIGRVYVNYRMPDPKLYVSAADVLFGRAPMEALQGKFVLVGTSAVGLKDIKRTPVSPSLPGVEVHANILETVLTQMPLSRDPSVEALEYFAALIGGLLMILLVPMVGAVFTAVLLVAVVGGVFGYSWFEYTGNLNMVDGTYPALTVFALYTFLTFTGYTKTSAEKKQVRGQFGHYLSPALVEQLADDPDRLKLGGEMKDMTFLFADIRGFTTISEQFKDDPQGLTQLINRFLTPMTDMILARNGTIDKYMGDCIMAFWNAPIDDDRHAENASASALAMFGALERLNDEIKAESEAEGRKFFPINIGIGLNTGNAVVGNMGSDQRFDYSVLGDGVNLASRLEGQSKNYGVGVVIGELTQNEVQDYATLELDLIAVKGKAEAVRIFTLLGDSTLNSDPDFKKLLALHIEMLASYRGQDWAGCLSKIEHCRAAENYNLDVLYQLYEERAKAYQIAPPGQGWDGVFRATSK